MKTRIESHTISWLINESERQNEKIYLPFYQRSYLWEKEKIESLFDSLINNYFFGSFLMVETDRSSESLYNLLSTREYNKYTGDSVNTIDINNGSKHYCLIDGQQRLTSFIISLNSNGFYQNKKRNKDYNYCLFLYIGGERLNLGEETENEDEEIGSGSTNGESLFKMFLTDDAPYSENKNQWFKVSLITSLHGNFLAALKKRESETSDGAPAMLDKDEILNECISSLLATNSLNNNEMVIERIKTLYNKIYNEELVSCVVLEDCTDDDALETFIRLNTKGTPLSYSDLLISKMSSWFERNDHVEGRSKDVKLLIKNIIDGIKTFDNDDACFKVNQSFILKTFIVLTEYKAQEANGREVDFKFSSIEKLNNEKIKMISDNWDKIASCINQTFKLINRGEVDLNGYFISSYNALIPITLFLFHQENLDSNTWERIDNETLKAIQWYLLMVPLNKSFNSHTDGAIKNLCDRLKNNDYNFVKFQSSLAKDIDTGVDKAKVDSWVKNIRYGKSKYALMSLLFILYPDVAKDGENRRISIEHLHAEKPPEIELSRIQYPNKKRGKEKPNYDVDKHNIANLSLTFQVGHNANSSLKNKSLTEKINIHANDQIAPWTDEYLYCDPSISKDIKDCYAFWDNRAEKITDKLYQFFKLK